MMHKYAAASMQSTVVSWIIDYIYANLRMFL